MHPITPNAYGTILDMLALIGYPGNTGDGFYVTGNFVRLRNCAAQGMGGDGLRIGSKIAPVPPQPANYYNANCCRIENFAAGHNGRDGISIDDASLEPSLDANTIELRAPLCYANGRHGLYLKLTIFGNVITCPLTEGNTGWGIYCDAGSYHNVIVGGDVEANSRTDLRECPVRQSIHRRAEAGRAISQPAAERRLHADLSAPRPPEPAPISSGVAFIR